jgi:hypothetical protein
VTDAELDAMVTGFDPDVVRLIDEFRRLRAVNQQLRAGLIELTAGDFRNNQPGHISKVLRLLRETE